MKRGEREREREHARASYLKKRFSSEPYSEPSVFSVRERPW
jgi:hypothetical protein